jgi:hypothetical protein
MEKVNGFSAKHLFPDKNVPEGRVIWAEWPAEKGGDFNTK